MVDLFVKHRISPFKVENYFNFIGYVVSEKHINNFGNEIHENITDKGTSSDTNKFPSGTIRFF